MKLFAKKNSDSNIQKTPKIVLDGVFFQFRDNSGIARVWLSLLEEWAGTKFGEQLVIADRDGAVPKIEGIGSYVEYKPYYSRGAAAEAFLIEDFCRRHNADLFISTHLTAPLETPSIAIVHDMIPELFGHDQTWLREKRYCTHHASAYIAVSNNSLNDLQKVYPFSKGRPSCVVPNGVSTKFHSVSADQKEEFKQKHQIINPYFLIVGSGSPHKNLQLFYQAFDRLPGKEKISILICSGSTNIQDDIPSHLKSDQIKVIPMSDEELNVAYNGALALVFPSKYEGFGLPILEAMATGCPVITCANASIPEVAGNAAIYVDDSDPDEMVKALIEVKAAPFREDIVKRGFAQVERFSWKQSAQAISNFITEIWQAEQLKQNGESSRLWRELRSYQCQPQFSVQEMRKLESEWFASIAKSCDAQSQKP